MMDWNCIEHKWKGKGFCPECEEKVEREATYQHTVPYRIGEDY